MSKIKTLFQSAVFDGSTLKQIKSESTKYCGEPEVQLQKMRDDFERIVSFDNIKQLTVFDATVRNDRLKHCQIGDTYFVRRRFDSELLMVFEARIRLEEPFQTNNSSKGPFQITYPSRT